MCAQASIGAELGVTRAVVLFYAVSSVKPDRGKGAEVSACQ